MECITVVKYVTLYFALSPLYIKYVQLYRPFTGDKRNCTMHWIVIYPLGRFIGALKNWGEKNTCSYRKRYKIVS